MSDFLRDFARRFAALDKDSLDRLGELYSADVLFVDPLHEIRGLAGAAALLRRAVRQRAELRFDFHGFDAVREATEAATCAGP